MGLALSSTAAVVFLALTVRALLVATQTGAFSTVDTECIAQNQAMLVPGALALGSTIAALVFARAVGSRSLRAIVVTIIGSVNCLLLIAAAALVFFASCNMVATCRLH